MAAISRRTLLSRTVLGAGVVVGAGLGFSRHVQHKVAVPPPPPPAELTRALAGQEALLAGYQGLTSAPAGLRADVDAHGTALRALLELYPGWRLAQQRPASSAAVSPSPTASASKAQPAQTALPVQPVQPVQRTRAGLAQASAALAMALTAAAQGWPATEPNAITVVPTLASIAAALSTHAEVLS